MSGRAARLELARTYAARAASCPECGTLCLRWAGYDRDGDLFDPDVPHVPWDVMPDWFVEAANRQGVGISRGARHVCPPCRSALLPDGRLQPMEVGS